MIPNIGYENYSTVAIRFLNIQLFTLTELARRVGSDGSMSASGSVGPGFNPRRGSKF